MTLDSYGIAPARLRDESFLIATLKEAARAARLNPVSVALERFPDGGGITAVVVLSQSHISVHTWPERGYAAFDLFTCDGRYVEAAEESLRGAFPGATWEVACIHRGRKLRALERPMALQGTEAGH